jgi:lysozyme family protein
MANFSDYFPKLLRNEGNYCHTPGDSGGETYRGIARAYNGHWPGWPIVDAAKRRLGLTSPVGRASWAALNAALGADTALSTSIQQFYKHSYWDSLRLDEVHSQSIAEQLADHGVNAGTSRPVKMLQYLLNTQFGSRLVVDGKIGPQSIAALNDVSAALFYLSLVEMRRAFYYYLAGSPLNSTPNMATWSSFLRTALNVRPNPAMHQFLPSWLSRTQAPFAG